jgi:hypothetical protein
MTATRWSAPAATQVFFNTVTHVFQKNSAMENAIPRNDFNYQD